MKNMERDFGSVDDSSKEAIPSEREQSSKIYLILRELGYSEGHALELTGWIVHRAASYLEEVGSRWPMPDGGGYWCRCTWNEVLEWRMSQRIWLKSEQDSV